jgi:ABC-type lipoprotein export system ATPase subunit
MITHDADLAEHLPRRLRMRDGEVVSDSRRGHERRAAGLEGVRP